MRVKFHHRVFYFVLMLLLLSGEFPILHPHTVQAQQGGTPFLITPYYGNEKIKSYFDHQYPTYDGSPNNGNKTLYRFDGAFWPDATKYNCSEIASQEGYELKGNCYDGHNGYDFGLSYEPVLAAADGTVLEVGWSDKNHHDGSYGLYVLIEHTHEGQVYRTRYGHLSTADVEESQSVAAGQIIGTSGSTGNSSGPHLHFDIYNSLNRALDPFGWTGSGNDPWASYTYGATSWCMWADGEWVNYCDSQKPSRPIPLPLTLSSEIITLNDTTNNSNGFSKGFGGLLNNPCTGTCQGWWQAFVGNNGHTYLTLADEADGDINADQWAKWQTYPLHSYAAVYEVYVWVPLVSSQNTFTWQAPYTIVDAFGMHHKTIVDEFIGSGENYNPKDKWLSLGMYYLDNGSYVYTTDATGDPGTHCPDLCQMTADAIKLVRRGSYYLPEIWDYPDSSIKYRSNSGVAAIVQVNYFTNNGIYCGSQSFTVPGNGMFSFGENSCSSAVVDASAPLSILVVNDDGSDPGDYTVIPPVTSASGVGTGTTVYIPAYLNNYYGWNSYLSIQNAGSIETNVYVTFFNNDGDPVNNIPPPTITLQPYGSMTVSMTGASNGSVIVSASQPLAVIVMHENPTYNMVFDSEGIVSEGTNAYIPNLFNNYYGWMSSIQVQETTGNAVTVHYLYYPDSRNPNNIPYSFQLNAWGHKEIYLGSDGPPGPWRGSVRLWVYSGNGKIVTAVHHTNNSVMRALGYHGFKDGAKDLIIPYVRRGDGWISSITVQNVGSVTTDVTLWYYDSDGLYTGTSTNFNLSAWSSMELQSAISNFNGSVQVHSSATNVVVGVHHANTTDGRHHGYGVP